MVVKPKNETTDTLIVGDVRIKKPMDLVIILIEILICMRVLLLHKIVSRDIKKEPDMMAHLPTIEKHIRESILMLIGIDPRFVQHLNSFDTRELIGLVLLRRRFIGANVRSVAYEVSTPDTGEVVENAKIGNFQQDGDYLTAEFTLSEPILMNREYPGRK